MLQCEHCPYTSPHRPLLIKHGATHRTLPNRCPSCARCFTSKPNLLAHTKVHCNENKHWCEECDRCFKKKSMLVYHQKSHRGDCKEFKCIECPLVFYMLGELGLHIKNVHSVMKVRCLVCDKGFVSRRECWEHHGNAHGKMNEWKLVGK